MNTSRGEAIQANVYNACDDEYRKGVIFNKEKLLKSPHHKVKVDGEKLDITINKDAEDIDEIFQSKGIAIPPDELLDMIKTSNIRIPMKQRDEFPDDIQLPSSELLKVIHYFASKKMTSVSKGAARSLDETALLAMGLMVEQWAEDLIDDSTAQLFLEPLNYNEDTKLELNESDNNSSTEASSSSSSSNSDSSDEDSE